MKRFLPFALLLLCVGACRAAKDVASIADFYGSWKVVRISAVDDITTSAKYRQALVGTIIRISPEKVTQTGEDDCPVDPSTDKASMVDSTQEMWRSEDLTPKAIGLPRQVEKLSLSCMDFYKVNDHLVFGDRGAWYIAERMR
jgi:hypothetical protein